MNAPSFVEGLTTFDPMIHHTVKIVSAYVGNNHVALAELPALIASVHAALGDLGKPSAESKAAPTPATSAEIRKSITPDGLISFLDGRSYKTLKRHLTTRGHTPASYRDAFGLPAEYPMVAASYSETRSALAKQIGLGAHGRSPASAEVA